MTDNQIHADAENLAAQFRALGRSVSVSHSVNRNGGSSSYLSVSGLTWRLRLSDHSSGTTTAVDVWADPAAMIAASDEARIRGAEKYRLRIAEAAARDATNLAAKRASDDRRIAAEQDVAARRRAFFVAAGIDFAALRGAERDAARAAFAAHEAAL